jgi:hypothetical protein
MDNYSDLVENLHVAIITGNIKKVKTCLQGGVQVDARDSQ